MSRTKVKQNLIDASFGNILEQIVYYADGKTVTTSAGNFTAPNITAITAVGSSSFVEKAMLFEPPTSDESDVLKITVAPYDASVEVKFTSDEDKRIL